LNEADGMIFQTETQLKELGEIIWWEQSSCRICIDWIENGSPISRYSAVQTALDNINAAWKLLLKQCMLKENKVKWS
jgi:molecular chaperone DnaK